MLKFFEAVRGRLEEEYFVDLLPIQWMSIALLTTSVESSASTLSSSLCSIKMSNIRLPPSVGDSALLLSVFYYIHVTFIKIFLKKVDI